VQMKRVAAVVYGVFSGAVIAFQLALALGAPLGAYAMGGAFPGVMPPALRAAAVVQACVLALLAGIVLARAGVALPRWSHAARRLIWLVVAFAGISLVLNLITPSSGERILWAPVALVLFVSGLVVAIGPAASPSS